MYLHTNSLCSHCIKTPLLHCFEPVGRSSSQSHIFYTCVGLAIRVDDYVGMKDHIDAHLATIRGENWSWILDCRGISAANIFDIKTIVEFIKYIREKYGNQFEKLHLLNSIKPLDILLKNVLPLFPNMVHNIVHYRDESSLLVMDELMQNGIPKNVSYWISKSMLKKPVKGQWSSLE